MKNILFIFTRYPAMGGLEMVSNNIIEFLSKDYKIFGISIDCQPNVPCASGIEKMIYWGLESTDNQRIELYNQVIKELKIDVVINQGMFVDMTTVVTNENRKQSVKLFSFLHSVPKYEEKFYWNLKCSRTKYLKRRFLQKFGLNGGYNCYVKKYERSYQRLSLFSDAMVMLCDQYVDDFVKSYKIESQRAKVIAIENPLSLQFSEQQEVDWNEKKNQVLYVGRLVREKRIDVLLDVWKQAQLGDNWELIIVGDGEERQELEQIIVDQSIKNVNFVGQTANPERYYKDAKIIMLTSNFEGFPMCLIEGQRFSVVPLVFDISSGVRSVVSCGGGVVVPNNERAAMSMKLKELTSDQKLLRELSRSARQKSNRYTIDQIGGRWKELIEK